MPFNFENVKIQLHAEHYLMNDCWLKDCVGYYSTEVNPQAVQAEIVKFVKDQWILSDLREINDQRGCLPENLAQQKMITLPGTYILQVEKGYDISTSKYKQVEKIRNVSSENIEVTEAEKNPTWEPKTKRMMYLYLTDGKQEVTAMEHKPIPFLKDHLLPGYKIMIKGPVILRRSVIMLESKNCSHVGGEIESLLIKNATENVLARALGLKENPDPYNDKKSDDKNEPLSLDEGMDIDMDALDQIEKKYDDNSGVKAPKTKPTSATTSRTKRRESVLLDSLPVCFDSIEQVENEFADDFDDMIGMIDEANLNVVGGGDKDVEIEEVKIEAENTRAGAFPEDDFPTDLEFDEFEFDSFPYEKTTNMLEEDKV
ncbi:GSCOCG00005663001-RA-CDS [Cotesia congregata]|nr:GSCOCG00005663001-RA-CDS [Cotesia congregata]